MDTYVLSVWCDFWVVGFLEKRVMPTKVYKILGDKKKI